MRVIPVKIIFLLCMIVLAGCLPRINIDVPKRFFNYDSGSESLNSKESKISFEIKSPGELEVVLLDENNNVRKFQVPDAHGGVKYVDIYTEFLSKDIWIFEGHTENGSVLFMINLREEFPQAKILSDEIESCAHGPFYTTENGYLFCTNKNSYPTMVNLTNYDDSYIYNGFTLASYNSYSFAEDDNSLYLIRDIRVLRITKTNISEFANYTNFLSSTSASIMNGALVVTDSQAPSFQVFGDPETNGTYSISGGLPTIPSYGHYSRVEHYQNKSYYLLCKGYYYEGEESIIIADLSNFAEASSAALNIDSFKCDSIVFLPLSGIMYFKAKSNIDNINSLYKITSSNTIEKVIELALPNYSNTIEDDYSNFLRSENKSFYTSYFLADNYLCFSGKYSGRFYPHCINEDHNLIRISNDSAEYAHTAHSYFSIAGDRLVYLEFEGGVKVKSVNLAQGNTSINFTSSLGLNLKNYWMNLGRPNSHLMSSGDSKKVGFLNPKGRVGEIEIREQDGETYVYNYDGDWEEDYDDEYHRPTFISKYNDKYLFMFSYNGARKLHILDKGQIREVDNNKGFHVRTAEGPITHYVMSKNNFYYTDDTYNFMRFDLETERHYVVDYAAISFTVDRVDETVYYSKNRGLSLHRVLPSFTTETIIDFYTDDYSGEDYSGYGEVFYYLDKNQISTFGNIPHYIDYDYGSERYYFVKLVDDGVVFDWLFPQNSSSCYLVSNGPHYVCYTENSRYFYLLNPDGSLNNEIESGNEFIKYGGSNKNNISLVLNDIYEEDDYFIEFIDLTSPDLNIIDFRLPENFADMLDEEYSKVEFVIYGMDVYLKYSHYNFVEIYKLSDLSAPTKIFEFYTEDFGYRSLAMTDLIDFNYESDEMTFFTPALRDGDLGMVEYRYNSGLVEISSYFVVGKDVAYASLGDLDFFNKIDNKLRHNLYSAYISELVFVYDFLEDIGSNKITYLDKKSKYLFKIESFSDYGAKFSIVNSRDLNKTLFDYEETHSDFFAEK